MEEEKKSYTASFARIYDDIMTNVPYEFWYEYIQEFLSYYDKNPTKILDLACGTGNMSLLFAPTAKKIVGIDRSEDMLAVAENKARQKEYSINYIQADLKKFEICGKFNLVFSVFDSMNYILSLENLKKVFDNVYRVLEKDGLFIFDMNTINRLMSIEPGTTMFTGDNYTCFWQDIVDKKNKKWQVRLKIYFDDNDSSFEEFHQETGYPVEWVTRALYEVGFEYIDIYKAFTFNSGNDNDNRLYYIVFKDSSVAKDTSFLKKASSRFKWKFMKF